MLWRLVGALPRELEADQGRLSELLLDLLLKVDKLGLDLGVDVTLLGQWTGCKPDNIAGAGSLLDRLLALAEVVLIPAVVGLEGVAVQRSRHGLLNLVHRHHLLVVALTDIILYLRPFRVDRTRVTLRQRVG